MSAQEASHENTQGLMKEMADPLVGILTLLLCFRGLGRAGGDGGGGLRRRGGVGSRPGGGVGGCRGGRVSRCACGRLGGGRCVGGGLGGGMCERRGGSFRGRGRARGGRRMAGGGCSRGRVSRRGCGCRSHRFGRRGREPGRGHGQGDEAQHVAGHGHADDG